MESKTRGRVLFFVIVLIGLNGCIISQEEGPSIYGVAASTDDGEKFVEEFKVAYICENVVSVFGADAARSKSGLFVFDVKLTESGEIQYKQLNKELVRIYGLKPKFTWWQDHGIWLAIPIVIIMFIIGGLISYLIYKFTFGS